MTEGGEPEPFVEEEFRPVVEESVSAVMAVVQIAYVVRQLEGRRIFLDGKRTAVTHSVDIDATAGRVLQFHHSLIVAVRTDIGERFVPCRVGRVQRPVHFMVIQHACRLVVGEIKGGTDG